LEPSQFGLKARLEAPSEAKLGDTITMSVEVTWTSAPHPWLILPQTSPENAKLQQIQVATEQSRTLDAGVPKQAIVVKYRMLAKDTGVAEIPALSFQIPTQNEAMTLQTEPAKIHIQEPVHWGLWFGILAGLVVLGLAVFNWRIRKNARKQVEQEARQKIAALEKDFALLGTRCMTADPRTWILELEGVCNQALALKGTVAEENRPDLVRLQDAFAQARYGGGPRDAWANKEWWRLAKKIFSLNLDTEDNHG
jgi:hypothetical protein